MSEKELKYWSNKSNTDVMVETVLVFCLTFLICMAII
jgi:hypothetical protein